MSGNELTPYGTNNLPILGNGRLPGRSYKEIEKGLARTAVEMVKSEANLEAGAFLASVGMTHLGMLSAVAEAVVEMHPAAAQGCAQIMNAYGLGAAEIIRRTVR
jgi:hypothetical protein